jgi:hypothetical protein
VAWYAEIELATVELKSPTIWLTELPVRAPA